MTTARAGLRPSNRLLYAGIALMLALSVGVQLVRDRGWAPFVPPNPTLWVSNGPLARRLALEYRSLVADVYWIRAVVYYGSRRLGTGDTRGGDSRVPANFDLLYPLLDLVTALDPHFKVAYRFGAIFLTEPYPNGPGRPDLAIALLQRGIELDSGRWEYMHDIGFVYYWWLRDFKQAAAWFKRAGEQPGGPSWLAPLAATTLAEGGDRDSSRFLWLQLMKNTDTEWVRVNGRHRIAQLDAMDTINDLNRHMDLFKAREHRPPRDWREFAIGQGFSVIPNDPTGTPYMMDPATGRIYLSPDSRLQPLPWEPGNIANVPPPPK